MINKYLFYIAFFFLANNSFSQTITYDTTYQVTEHDGVIDSVIIIHQHVEIVNEVIVVDSSQYKLWGVDLIYGFDKVGTSFEVPLGTFSEDYISTSGFSIGGSVYYNNDPWSIRGGLNFLSHSNRRGYSRTYEAINDYWQLNVDTLDTYFVIEPSGDTVTHHITESELERVEERSILKEQRGATVNIKVLEIPVQFGYSIHHKKWHYSFLVGLNNQITLAQTSEYINEFGEVNEQTFTSFNVMAMLSTQIQYNLSEYMLIFAEPVFRKSFFRKNTSQHITDIQSIRLGLKYFL